MNNEIVKTLLYTSEDGAVAIKVIIDSENDTMWTTQKTMAELFGKNINTISTHLNNIFESGELIKSEVTFNPNDFNNTEIVIINPDAKTQPILYNLDAIISVGYRVNSKQATHFRKWATSVLREYIVKGFAMDDELLKKGTRFGKDYFDHLLSRIREIRASERRFNQKITDLYATSADYNLDADETKDFFSTVQNMLLFAITGQTAAEIIKSRSDKNKINMGLTTWEDAPHGKILQADVVISKNYLNEMEIDSLNTLVDGFLTLAETRANSQKPTFMKDWKTLLYGYLELSQLPLLEGKGKVSSIEAKTHAINEYKEFRIDQDRNYESDFDNLIKTIKQLEGKK
ncbi:MAG: virulence RhuM family protein [Methanobrevibacter sp.]|nr:virulence RhuM family protein [Methanobrevibacter sp.]